MSKEQEFLENLKNPITARLKQAVNEFFQNHCHSIHLAHPYEYYKDAYVVEVMADDKDILIATEEILISTIEKYLKKPRVNVRKHPTQLSDGLYRRTYYVYVNVIET